MTLDHDQIHKRRNSDLLPRYFPRNSEEKENCSNDVRRDGYNCSSSRRELRQKQARNRAMRYSVTGQCPNVDKKTSAARSRAVGRSQSMKTTTTARRTAAAGYSIDHHRSSPNLGRTEVDDVDDCDDEYCRLRNFVITRKGAVVNRGDSFRSKSRSAHSVSSNNKSETEGSVQQQQQQQEQQQQEGQDEDLKTAVVVRHRVLMLGASDVGKTALTSQFRTSEYICACDASQDNSEEKSVTVIVDDQEADLTFVDPALRNHQIVKWCSSGGVYEADAYVIVYSVTSRPTFRRAKEILAQLHKSDSGDGGGGGAEWMNSKAVIVVANKIDLVRSRAVSTDEGRHLAKSNRCKYIETSVGINHNVDNLLVGILCQIRLKNKPSDKLTTKDNMKPTKAGSPGSLLKRLLRKAYNSRTKSCDDLNTL